MAATYLSGAVLERLDHHEAELHRHLVAGTGGRCLTCGEPEPCSRRLALGQVLVLAGRLPRRHPGVLGRHVFGIEAV
jgi:hypothetical protein